ncbi:hypothetical protein VU01_10492 [Candidatus Electrothrix marina]|uniref:DUF7674 domain-containing protein n=1 Tax=Candidatus Electrothrix marina TaxID=1859130 RepID=A0A3S3SUL7_9BACT|nr:hypothetical protein VU00_10274 [Candidatus Electrothrix marina]RWX52023.1 hypothetical protein VU01_10492 [Candidatus Electrothrix marina]
MTPLNFVSKLSLIDQEFKHAANEVYKEWADDPPVPVCILVGAMGDVIRDELHRFDDKLLSRIFELIEDALVQGDDHTKDAVATCLLENLQNYASGGTFDFGKVSRFLGNKSRCFCKAWDKFSGIYTTGL